MKSHAFIKMLEQQHRAVVYSVLQIIQHERCQHHDEMELYNYVTEYKSLSFTSETTFLLSQVTTCKMFKGHQLIQCRIVTSSRKSLIRINDSQNVWIISLSVSPFD